MSPRTQTTPTPLRPRAAGWRLRSMRWMPPPTAARGGRHEQALTAQVHALGDDRARLARDLDSAVARSRALEAANREVAQRIERAIETIRGVLGTRNEATCGDLSASEMTQVSNRPGEDMSQVSVTINGRQFRMACEDGQEGHLMILARDLDTRIEGLRQNSARSAIPGSPSWRR